MVEGCDEIFVATFEHRYFCYLKPYQRSFTLKLGHIRPCIRQNGLRLLRAIQHRNITSQTTGNSTTEFDEKMLEILVCPLTKKPLRYNKETNELISDSINVAFPIVNGIPNLVPQDGRLMDAPDKNES